MRRGTPGYADSQPLQCSKRLKTEAITDFRKAQSIDPADQTSKEQLRSLGG